jgi:kinesin family protein 2/24
MPQKSTSLRDLVTNELSIDITKGRARRSLPAVANSSTETKGPIFVHGMPEDNSWGAQVARLRADNQAEHELFAGHCLQPDDEQMRIRVIIRKRPMSSNEASTGNEIDVVHPLEYNDYGRVLVYQPKTRVDLTKEIEQIPFAFDNVFDESSSNVQIYERSVRNLVPGVFEGRWASVFAYGQTGSGKTFTMMGSNLTGINAGNATNHEANLGLYYMAAMDVFELASRPEYRHLTVGASLFEIYGGKLFDLLNDRKPVKCLENHRGKVCFPGLSEHPVSNANELMDVIEAGAVNRSTGSTSKNADSSRSHAVLQLSLRKDIGRQQSVEYGKFICI